MNRKFIFAAVLAFLSGSLTLALTAQESPDGFREALRLMDRGYSSRAEKM